MTSIPFTNLPIESDQYPDVYAIDTFSLSEKYCKANRLVSLAVTLILTLIVSIVAWQPWIDLHPKLSIALVIGSAVIVFIGLWITVYHYFADPLKSYALREHDLSYSSGLIFRKFVTQPITRIQHIELSRGPIERKIGLATLQVFSAGGVMHTFEIPGLPLAEAQKLRQFILQHKDSLNHG